MCGADFDNMINGKTASRQTASANRAIDLQNAQFQEQLAYAKQHDAEQQALAQAQFDYQKQLATQTDAERKAQSDAMMAEATLTPEKIAEATGGAAGTVTKQFDNAQAAQQRGLTAMGVDPGTMRSVSADRSLALTKAGATAGAINSTRSQMRDISQQRMDNARLVRIGLNPLALNVTNTNIGLPSATLGTMSQGVGMYGNQAGMMFNQASATRQAGMGLIGDVIGAAAKVAGAGAGVAGAGAGG